MAHVLGRVQRCAAGTYWLLTIPFRPRAPSRKSGLPGTLPVSFHARGCLLRQSKPFWFYSGLRRLACTHSIYLGPSRRSVRNITFQGPPVKFHGREYPSRTPGLQPELRAAKFPSSLHSSQALFSPLSNSIFPSQVPGELGDESTRVCSPDMFQFSGCEL